MLRFRFRFFEFHTSPHISGSGCRRSLAIEDMLPGIFLVYKQTVSYTLIHFCRIDDLSHHQGVRCLAHEVLNICCEIRVKAILRAKISGLKLVP